MNNEYRNNKVSEDGVEKESLLREGERLDDLQTGGYCLIQNPSLFCFGIDAVLLSSFAKVKKGAGFGFRNRYRDCADSSGGKE